MSRLLFVAACVALTQSCRDASGPGEVKEAAFFEAVSPTSFIIVVGTVVDDVPAVLIRDTDGNPLGGATVVFTVTRGGSHTSAREVTSNSLGIARLRDWVLPLIPILNEITASSGTLKPVQFQATTVVAPPASIIMFAGDAQLAGPGHIVPIAPQVKVSDRYGNPIPGIAVHFSVKDGGGIITGPTAMTDSSGVATVGAWRLGSRGSQTLVANAAQLAPVSFTATVRAPLLPCATENLLLEGVPVPAELTSESCRTGDGRYYERVRVVIEQSDAYDFSLSSNDFDTHLELRGADAIAENDNRDQTNSGIKALLLPGVYTLIIRSTGPRVTGAYAVGFRTVSPIVDACEDAFVMRGIVTEQLTTLTDCSDSSWEQVDRFRIYLASGTPLSVHLDDLSYTDFGLIMTNSRGEIAAVGGHAGGYRYSLNFTPTASGYYQIEISNRGDSGARYIMTLN